MMMVRETREQHSYYMNNNAIIPCFTLVRGALITLARMSCCLVCSSLSIHYFKCRNYPVQSNGGNKLISFTSKCLAELHILETQARTLQKRKITKA